MDLLNSELKLIELALEELLVNLTPLPNGDTGNLTKDLTKLSNRITKELAERIDIDNLQFEQLASKETNPYIFNPKSDNVAYCSPRSLERACKLLII